MVMTYKQFLRIQFKQFQLSINFWLQGLAIPTFKLPSTIPGSNTVQSFQL